MPKARIIGIGSPFGDDVLGFHAIELIERSGLLRCYPPGWIELRRLDRPGPELIEHLQDLDLAVLIDAMHSGATPGSVRVLRPAELDALIKPVSSHGFDLGATLRLAHALGALPRRLHILGIEMAAVPDADPDRGARGSAPRIDPSLLQAVDDALSGLTQGGVGRFEA